eukprot:g70487.t1
MPKFNMVQCRQRRSLTIRQRRHIQFPQRRLKCQQKRQPKCLQKRQPKCLLTKADAEGKRGNARSPINKLRGKRSKGKNVDKFREGKKRYVSFVDDVSKPNVIYDEADTNDVTRKEAISMIFPGDVDVYFVAIDEYEVRVFHSWSAVKLFYNNESPPLFTKFCEDKRKKSG